MPTSSGWIAALLATTLLCSVTLFAVGVPQRAAAQAEPAGTVSPAELPAALRPRLESLLARWPQLSPQQRERAIQRARAWLSLSAKQQSDALQRLARWQRLGPPMQAALRQNLPHWQAFNAEQRQRLQSRLQEFRALPETEQAALRSAFDALSPAARRALLPASPEVELSRLARELFVFVPLEDRRATLRMLGALSESAMDDLRALVVHRAPWQNETLRRELLDQPPEQREAWLGRRRAER